MNQQTEPVPAGTGKSEGALGWLPIDEANYLLLPAWLAQTYPALASAWTLRATRDGHDWSCSGTLLAEPIPLVEVMGSPERVLLADPLEAAIITTAREQPPSQPRQCRIWRDHHPWSADELLTWFVRRALWSGMQVVDRQKLRGCLDELGRIGLWRETARLLGVPYDRARSRRSKYRPTNKSFGHGGTKYKGVQRKEGDRDD